MKNLLVYFLFFVSAAFLLIQCARFFPSYGDPLGNLPDGKFKSDAIDNGAAKNTSNSPANHPLCLTIKDAALNLYFTDQSFPLNMVKYISHYQFLSNQYWRTNENKIETWQLFYNPYTSFTFTGLFKNNSDLIENNPFDLRK
jgi:hypothetical protein